MSEQKETGKSDDLFQGLRWWEQMLLGKLHEGISQLSGEAQDFMLQKHAEGNVEAVLLAVARMSGRDPRSFDVDTMIKHHQQTENLAAKGRARVTREGNIITWKSSLAHCYEPNIEYKTIKPYPAYCKSCVKYFFEGLYKIPHKGPVKVEVLKSVLNGDGECVARVELL